MQSNDLIFTTKGRYGIGYLVAGIIIVCVLTIIIAINYAGAAIICIGAGLLLGIPLGKNIGMYKSFIELYSDHLVGLTIPKKVFGGLNEMHTFEFKYQEITNVDYKTNVVVLSVYGTQYEVQARGCEQQVINIIKQQQILNEQQ